MDYIQHFPKPHIYHMSMRPLVEKLKRIIIWIVVSMLHGMTAQVINHGAHVYVQDGAILTVEGSLINQDTGSITNHGTMIIKGSLLNNSSQNLNDGNGLLELAGNSTDSIGGTNLSRFYDLRINHSSGILLTQHIQVDHHLQMMSGNLDLGGHDITLADTASLLDEADFRRIFGSSGKIQTTRDLFMPDSNIAGLGVGILSGAVLGTSTISRDHIIRQVGNGSSIERSFSISPENNENLDATLIFHYFDSELNSQDPNKLSLFRLAPDSVNWTLIGGQAHPAQGYVDTSGIEFMGRWTLSSWTIGIDDPRPSLEVSYYPNPLGAGELLHLTGLAQGSYEFQLFDMKGKMMMQQHIRAVATDVPTQLTFPDLALGMYSIQLLSEEFQPLSGKLLIHAH